MIALSIAVRAGEAQASDEISFHERIQPLLNRYCTGCHAGDSARGSVRLDFTTEDEARRMETTDADYWSRVATAVASELMPPSFAHLKPTAEQRALIDRWVSERMLTADGNPDPGPFMVRRLNNREYANSIRDLLYLPADYDASADFPPDERGDGFDNNSGTLTISPLLIERYLRAVEDATVAALSLDPTQTAQAADATLARKTKLNDPSRHLDVDFANRQEKIRLNMETFAPRAFRRPVSSEEIDELMAFAALSFAHAGESYDQATGLAIRAALMAPEFLFRLERDPDADGTGKVFQITEYQLASRMSYFLWSTMPDEELFLAARDGRLRSNLDRHIARMLQDPKAISLTKDFLGQWLEVRGIHETANAPKALLDAMQGETERFFDYIVRNDRSILELLDADYTFVNEDLAKLYGIEDVTGEELRKVDVDPARRGGIFTQASFLTLTSKPRGDSRRTSPVLRGKWILENIFNETIPPPPPDVPEVDFDPNKRLTGTVREIFEQHRVDPNCAVCHERMDPYGFALENYDGYGAWRDVDNGQPVDPSGEIRGKEFETPKEFRAILADRKDDFRRALIVKMLGYALGRGILSSDRAAINAICEAVEADGDRFSSIIRSVIRSYPFQHARGMKGDVAEDPSSTTWHHPVNDLLLPVRLPTLPEDPVSVAFVEENED